MNVKPLLKYFPEIHHLPLETQQKLLHQAHDQVYGAHNKLRTWRNNLLGFGLLILTCTLMIAVVGPWLGLQSSTIGTLLILIIFPLYLFGQHRLYIARLQPIVRQHVQQITHQQA